jgi:hypothetical protein
MLLLIGYLYNYVVEPGLRPGSTYFQTWFYLFSDLALLIFRPGSTYFHNRYRDILIQEKLSKRKQVSSSRYFLLRFFYFNSKQDN